MRIAFDSQVFAMQRYGGVSRYFYHLAKELHGYQQDVKIFSPLYINKYIEDLPGGIVGGYPWPSYLPVKNRIRIRLNFLLSRKKIASWNPGVVHETYYTEKNIAPSNCPSVITIHDMIHEKFPEYFPRSDNTSRIKKNAIRKATHIICISQNTKKDLIDIYAVDDKKITVIHHGVETFKKCEGLNPLYSNKRPYLLYVGARSGYKNFNKMMHAISCSRALMENFDVIAFGGGEFNRIEQEQSLALGFRLNQVRHINGDDGVMRNLFQGASAFVYPSLYEGFGLPPLEAMVNQCPVISSNTSSMPEVILDAAEYFNPNLSDEIRLAIERVVFSAERSQELIDNGNKRVLFFGWDQCAAKTLDVYKKIL